MPARPTFLCFSLLLLSGCAESRTGTVQGKVSIDGTLITFGTVAFIGADGRVESAMIKPDGTYEAAKAPVGEAVVTVQTYPLPPQVQPPDQPMKGPPQPGQARYVPIPERYAEATRTPLRCTVRPGVQTHDLELTRKKP